MRLVEETACTLPVVGLPFYNEASRSNHNFISGCVNYFIMQDEKTFEGISTWCENRVSCSSFLSSFHLKKRPPMQDVYF